ncbi:hypothetical protein BS17DRAFT_766582 [Gyrodon lividus]|nr:hypothetical protein BS17DRAFT_766582 [Gyrodon lividus]
MVKLANPVLPSHASIVTLVASLDICTIAATTKATSSATSQTSSSIGKAPNQGEIKKAGWTASKSPSENPSSNAQGGWDKWQELDIPKMPPACSMWWKVMDLVDKHLSRVKFGLLAHGYCSPDPALLLTPQSPGHRRIYMANWLAICPLWISHVNHNPLSKFLAPQLWRDFLNSIPSQEQLDSITSKLLLLFGEDIVTKTQGSTWVITDTVEWCGHQLTIESLANPPLHVMQGILWKLHELSFWYKVYALNHVMAAPQWAESFVECWALVYSIFPGDSGLVMWNYALPTQSSQLGLSAFHFHNMTPHLNKFLFPFHLLSILRVTATQPFGIAMLSLSIYMFRHSLITLGDLPFSLII